MASSKLSALGESFSLNPSDLFLIVSGGINRKISASVIKEYMSQEGVTISIVQQLPETGASNKIYLLANESGKANNIYDEYIWADSAWKFIGNKCVELENYYTKAEIDSKITDIQNQINTINGGG